MFTVLAPAFMTASTTRARKSLSVREASSGENSTSGSLFLAYLTAWTAASSISDSAFFSLYFMWILEVARKTCIRGFLASLSAA